MFKRDKFFYGFLAALLLPALAWCYEFAFLATYSSPRSVFLITIGLNLFLVRIAYKKDLDRMASGLMFATFLVAILIFFFKLNP